MNKELMATAWDEFNVAKGDPATDEDIYNQKMDFEFGYMARVAQEAYLPNAASAAIEYALRLTDDTEEFLIYWHAGEFDILRRNWDSIPDAVFIGADPLFKVAE